MRNTKLNQVQNSSVKMAGELGARTQIQENQPSRTPLPAPTKLGVTGSTVATSARTVKPQRLVCSLCGCESPGAVEGRPHEKCFRVEGYPPCEVITARGYFVEAEPPPCQPVLESKPEDEALSDALDFFEQAQETATHTGLTWGYVAGMQDAAERLDALARHSRGLVRDVCQAMAAQIRGDAQGTRNQLYERARNAANAFASEVTNG